VKYLTVTLIDGKAADEHQKLRRDIAEKFDVHEAMVRKSPSHITLKYSFNTESVWEVERLYENFCNTHEKCKYTLKGTGIFERDVIFLRVLPSLEMMHLQNKLIKNLRSIKWMTIGSYDKPMHFHASLAHGDLNGKFEDVLDYATKRNKINYEMTMDNIVLLKLEDCVWKLHKEYKLR
jgi:2'-5' RNA ligase